MPNYGVKFLSKSSLGNYSFLLLYTKYQFNCWNLKRKMGLQMEDIKNIRKEVSEFAICNSYLEMNR